MTRLSLLGTRSARLLCANNDPFRELCVVVFAFLQPVKEYGMLPSNEFGRSDPEGVPLRREDGADAQKDNSILIEG